jgi:hypothetical protein
MTPSKPKAPGPLDIFGHFASLPDPRHTSFRDFYLLEDIPAVALCSVLSGATSWEIISAFGTRKLQSLRSLGLTLASGAGAIRYRHTGATHDGAGSLPNPSLRRLDRPE